MFRQERAIPTVTHTHARALIIEHQNAVYRLSFLISRHYFWNFDSQKYVCAISVYVYNVLFSRG